MKELIRQTVQDAIETKQRFFAIHEDLIEACARRIVGALRVGGKLLLFGNGGSAADCQHIAAEFINRFQMERRPLPAVALTCDTSVITSIGNDYSFEEIFSKQVQALGHKGDIAIGISTSGNSPNVIRAATAAKAQGLTIVGFSGTEGKLKEISDMAFCVESPVTARVQEVHITLGHILCDLSERMLFHDQG